MNLSTSMPQSNSSICGHLPFTVNMVSYDPKSAMEAVTYFTCVFNAVSLPFTVIGNILVFFGVLRKPELRTVHYTSILFLAATDLLVALVAQPGFVIYQASKLYGRGLGFSCVALAVYTSTVFICTGLSILTLIIITLERYFAIFYPFKYQQFVTTSRLIRFIFVVWLIWIVFISVVRFAMGTTTSTLGIIATVLIISCLVVTLVVYCKVQKLVQRNRKTVPEATLSAVSESCAESSQRRNIPETKSSRTAAILTGTLAICLLPTLISSAVFQSKAANVVTLYHVIYPLTDTAVILNSTLNPFIYVFRSQIIRRSIKDIFTKRL